MTPGRPREFDHKEALERAMSCFWEKGYEGTGMSELVSSMGIGRQSLYNTFGDKRALFLEALRNYQQTYLDRMLAPMRAPGASLASVKALIDGWEAATATCDRRGCLMVNTLAEQAAHDPEIAQILRDSFLAQEDAIAAALERALALGELSPSARPRPLAQALVALGHSLALLGRVDVPQASLQGILETARGLLSTE